MRERGGRRRRAWSIACCACFSVLLPTWPARGQALVVIPPTPPAAPATPTPALDPPTDLESLTGAIITRIVVALEGNAWDDVHAPPVTTVKPGESFTPALARQALDELLASGHFARGSVSAAADHGGVLVIVRVVPRKLVGRLEVDLHGAHIDRDEVLRESELSEGGEMVGADLPGARARVQRLFALHGYPAAEVDIATRQTDDPARAIVLVDVRSGPPRVLDDRRFYVFDAKPEEVLPLTVVYPVQPKDRADEPAIAAADAALAQALRSKGWHHATLSHDLVRVGEQGKPARVVLRVRIDAGPRQVPRFEGNDHYDTDTLTAVLALETEPDRSPSHLADKLRGFYQRRGFLDVDVRAEVRGGGDSAVRLLFFHVDERARVGVVARRYPCLKLEAIRGLSNGGPRTSAEIGTEIDSFLDEELPGADLFVDPNPRGLSDVLGGGGGTGAIGSRPEPVDLQPDSTYVADTYDRAVAHLKELYRNEGFLHAQVGPVQVLRAHCDPRSPPDRCRPLPLPPRLPETCTYDATGLPLPSAPLDGAYTCQPDDAKGIACAPSMQLVIPMKLGPRTRLWDIAFTGVKSVGEQKVAQAAQVALGEPASAAHLDEARRRIADWYKERGNAYVDVKYALEPSPDQTRARVRFDIVEGDQVIVGAIVLRGLEKTHESLVRRRIAIEVGQPFRTSDVRKTQERIATLGVFSSVSVSLSEPYVPQPNKTVIVDLVEREPQYVEVRPGFSTGEGVRGAVEYAHRNLLGLAWGVTVHAQASYLPDFLILDPAVARNYSTLGMADRVATRDTLTFSWPEMGLGPSIRSQLDGIYVRDLERDFTLVKGAVVGTLLWRPFRELQITVGPSYEHNDVHLFGAQTIEGYLSQPDVLGNVELQRLLRVPDGDSYIFAEHGVLTWDRRDSTFNAHRGTYVAAGVEHVDSFPISGTAPPNLQFESHFLRLTQTLAGYIPLTRRVSLAAEIRFGEIVNVSPCAQPFSSSAAQAAPVYCTYPDRLFFMGGFDSMRGWLQDTFIPQEYVDQIAQKPDLCKDSGSNCPGVPLRGGNLMFNPRLELRFPVKSPLEAAVFADVGNLWNDPSYVLSHPLTLRADVGVGLRVQTPVGPLVFDYGVNVTRKSYEDFGAFHFAIGLF